MQLLQTQSNNGDFIFLLYFLDKELFHLYGDSQNNYTELNNVENIRHVILAFDDEQERVIGCGAIKKYDADSMEIKRMFVIKEKRGNGIATGILKGLEKWAKELGYGKCILETGPLQPEAINMYQKNGYESIPNFGPYVGMDRSVCFSKTL